MFYDHEGKTLESYSKAPLEVLHDKDLKDFSKILYFEMFSIYDQNKRINKFIFPKNDTLASKLGVAVVTVRKALKDLEENKYIYRRTSKFDTQRQSKLRHIYFNELQKNDNNKVSYVEFPKSLYFADITNFQKLIVIELLSLNELFSDDRDGFIQVSNQDLAVRFSKSRSTIIRNLQQLKNKGYIRMNKYRDNTRYIYLENSVIFHKSYLLMY